MNRYIIRHSHLLPVKVTNAFQMPTTRALSTAPLRFASDSTPASTPSTRRVITLTPDNGHKPWANLTRYEKAARTTEQSFNFLTILTGVVMTGGVITFLYLEVFSSDSKTAHFNRVVDAIRQDVRCTDMLGRGSDIKAYGEPTWSRWARNRKIAGDFEKDGRGVEHLRMHFNVSGSALRNKLSRKRSLKPEI